MNKEEKVTQATNKVMMYEMVAMPINTIREIFDQKIQRVPGGWIYIYQNKEGIIYSTCFVPEISFEKISNEVKPQPQPQTDDNFHNDYIVHWKDKNDNNKSKHIRFTDQKHMDNWEKSWNKYDNKIIGYYPADGLGNLIETK